MDESTQYDTVLSAGTYGPTDDLVAISLPTNTAEIVSDEEPTPQEELEQGLTSSRAWQLPKNPVLRCIQQEFSHFEEVAPHWRFDVKYL